ncbi:FIG000605: protein co-occurring with transport systems (COG1739) [hydrothermal vent metagenome]|uniref:FIG000605: protein co-occurring with transport systems (COG1739) n=1 Tax=hydrothermal vent metagenome TaxID=652676 RepID=A0A1W1D381_9ZZZZ
MKFVQDTFIETLEVKQSKFIAHLLPFKEYEATLQKLKLAHPKARHFVVAYRYLNEFSQVVEYSLDDGEPKGTSGKPSLMVLQGEDLIDTAVIIVRYFGGTKLGTGGLVRAYSDAVHLVIKNAKLFEYKKQTTIKIKFSYSDIRVVEYECELCDITIDFKDYQNEIVYKITGSQENIDTLLQNLTQRNIAIEVES